MISDVNILHSCLGSVLDCGRSLGTKNCGFARASNPFICENRRKGGGDAWDLPSLSMQTRSCFLPFFTTAKLGMDLW